MADPASKASSDTVVYVSRNGDDENKSVPVSIKDGMTFSEFLLISAAGLSMKETNFTRCFYISNGAEVYDPEDLMPGDKVCVSTGGGYMKEKEEQEPEQKDGLLSGGLSAIAWGASWAYGKAANLVKDNVDEQTRKNLEDAEAKAANALAPIMKKVKEVAQPAVDWTDEKLDVATDAIVETKKNFDESEQGKYLQSTLEQAKKASISTSQAIKATIEANIHTFQRTQPSTKKNVSVHPIGKVDGRVIRIFTLRNTNGMTVSICNFGAAITRCCVADKSGNIEDVVLSSESVGDLKSNSAYLGVLVGRLCARTGGASFTLNKTTYPLTKNDNAANHLHGGNTGLSHAIWRGRAGEGMNGPFVHLERTSPDGEDGYPGEMSVVARYTLSSDNTIKLVISAVGTKDCPDFCFFFCF